MVFENWIEKKKLKYVCCDRDDFDASLPETAEGEPLPAPQPALEVYQQSRRLLLVFEKKRDGDRFERLCRRLVDSLESESPRLSYVGLALAKEHVIEWIAHTNRLLWR